MPPTRECFEPEKPYEQGAGHYTGYKWAEEGHACSGLTASESFNESWEEYEADEDEYQTCVSNKRWAGTACRSRRVACGACLDGRGNCDQASSSDFTSSSSR